MTTTRRDPVRAVLMLAMALVAIALAFRLVADGIDVLTDTPDLQRTTIPTVVIDPRDVGINPNPTPRLTRPA